MKTNRFTTLYAAAAGLAAFSAIGCSAKEQATDAPSPPTQDAATATPRIAVADWADIQFCTYDMRAQFFAGLRQLEARVDEQIAELTAKRAIMDGNAETKDWDFAMKEMENARTFLKSAGEELRDASDETWIQRRDRVGRASARSQDAYGKVKASTTT